MRVPRSHVAAAGASLVAWLLPLVSAISVPTGKLAPIAPARPTPRYVNPRAPAAPAPVVEYSQDHPEPPPLDPSYVPQNFNYFDTLARHHISYFPVRYRNFNALSNDIEYEPPQKFLGQTLGKYVGYKPYKQQLTVPYYPAWASQQYQPTSQPNQQNNQQGNQAQQHQSNQQDNQQSNGVNQYNQAGQFTNQPGQYSHANQYNPQANNQYNPQANNQYNQPSNQNYNYQQTTQQQQQYEAVSTQSSPASTAPSTQGAPTPQAPLAPKVDYSTGKGSYDVTGKGGSRSEYYTKEDWSKKTSYPKKVVTRFSKYPGKY